MDIKDMSKEVLLDTLIGLAKVSSAAGLQKEDFQELRAEVLKRMSSPAPADQSVDALEAHLDHRDWNRVYD